MKVYAETSLKFKESKKKSTKTTSPDSQNETNPRWNFPVEYTISESSVQRPGVSIVVELYCKRTFADNKYIGEVNIPIKGLYERGLRSESMTYSVAGTSHGKLNLLYSFSDKFTVAHSQKSSSSRVALKLGFFVLLHGAMNLLGADLGDCEGFGGEVDDWEEEVDDDC